MIQLFKVRMSDTVASSVSSVLESGFIGQGSVVEQFEDTLWKELGSYTRPVTVNSCTSAIDLALELCGIDNDSEVIATPLTCWASNTHIVHRKAKIRWADIDPITGLIDPVSVQKLITDKTKAIVAVNWAGKICDFSRLKSFGVPVIEDAAHTWDVFSQSKNLIRGDYIAYSFQAIKFLTSGDGGILICPKEKEHEARLLRWFGLDRTKGASFRCTQNIRKAGFKYHMNDINASIGLSNIDSARDSVTKHRNNSKYFIENINNPKLILPEWDDTCSYWLFTMHVLGGERDKFVKYLEEHGIASSPVHYRNDLYDCTIQFKENILPGVDSFSDTQINIPNGWWLSQLELDTIVQMLNNYD
jgi:dTDP-4-amino-4,6-dideoxygalactose transaminase